MDHFTYTYTLTHTRTHTSHFHVTFHALLRFNKAVSHDINSMAVRNCNPHVTHTQDYIQTWAYTQPACVCTHITLAVSVSTWSVKTQAHAGFDPEKLLSLCFIHGHFLLLMTSLSVSFTSHSKTFLSCSVLLHIQYYCKYLFDLTVIPSWTLLSFIFSSENNLIYFLSNFSNPSLIYLKFH